jgi:hypothetical protein
LFLVVKDELAYSVAKERGEMQGEELAYLGKV